MKKVIFLLFFFGFVQSEQIDITGLDKKVILKRLYHKAVRVHKFIGKVNLESNEWISGYVEYLYGRAMFIDLSGNIIDTCLYERDNYNIRVKNIIDSIRK